MSLVYLDIYKNLTLQLPVYLFGKFPGRSHDHSPESFSSRLFQMMKNWYQECSRLTRSSWSAGQYLPALRQKKKKKLELPEYFQYTKTIVQYLYVARTPPCASSAVPANARKIENYQNKQYEYFGPCIYI